MIRPSIRAVAVALTLFAAAAVSGGCGSSGPKKPTHKEAAIAKWNDARASVLLTLANDQYKAGHYDKARQTVNEAMKKSPQSPAVWVLSGKLNIEQGQLEPAERDLTKAAELAPAAAEPHYLLGVIYQRWQRLDAALAEYQVASDKSPGELAYVLARAETLMALDRPKDALALLQEKLSTFDNNPIIRDAAGQLLMQQGRYGEAVDVFRQATLLATEDLALKERLARALFSAGRHREASDVLTRLARDEQYAQRSDLQVMIGECALQTDRPMDARAAFEVATQVNPSSVPGWQGIAKVALSRGDLSRAELAIRRATAIDSADPQNHLLLGYLRLRQDRLNEAMTAFRKASALDANDPVGLCMTGYVLEKMGQPQQAIEFYARALKAKPDDELAAELMAGVGSD
jgi:superkiller protein 3